MNDESTKHTERELQHFAAAPLPTELANRLKQEPLDEPLTIADRILVTFSALGAIAAAIIVTVVIIQLASPSSPQPTANDLAAQQKLVAEYKQLLAAR